MGSPPNPRWNSSGGPPESSLRPAKHKGTVALGPVQPGGGLGVAIAPSQTNTSFVLITAESSHDRRGNHESTRDGEEITDIAARSAPPWLASVVAHLLLLVLLGILFIPAVTQPRLNLEAIFADSIGSQLDDELSNVGIEPVEPEEPQIPLEEPLAAEDPVAAPDVVESPTEDSVEQSSLVRPEVLGHALEGRDPAAKETLRAAYGGTALTEAAVVAALEWLKRNQLKNGQWSLRAKYANGARNENMLAATSMALLAFQGNGSTHQRGEYKNQVQRGMTALLAMQSESGDFWQKGAGRSGDDRLYAQAQGTIAICELYAMSRDPSIKQPAQLAIDYAVQIQDRQGGWRYQPGDGSDTSVTGWFVMALQSAMMGGLNVPSKTLEGIEQYLDLASDDGGSRYGYRPGVGHDTPMTAEALLCRQYLGWPRNDPRLIAGVEHISLYPIDWNNQNSYYWYYATQVMHHMGGDAWREWNDVMRETLPARQQQDGKESGSWSPVDDQWGAHGGRLYMTCMCTYMLEVYYRHLPIYELPSKATGVLKQETDPTAEF